MTKITKKKFELPSGEYMIGCPLLLTSPNVQQRNKIFMKEGLGEVNGYKFLIFETKHDGYFNFYDMGNSDHSGEPEHIDSLATDVALMSIIPMQLINDQEAAEEFGFSLTIEDYDLDGNKVSDPVKVTVYRDSTKGFCINEIDIEWYKLAIWNQ